MPRLPQENCDPRGLGTSQLPPPHRVSTTPTEMAGRSPNISKWWPDSIFEVPNLAIQAGGFSEGNASADKTSVVSASKTFVVSADKASVVSADKTSVASQEIPQALSTEWQPLGGRPPVENVGWGDVLGDHRCFVDVSSADKTNVLSADTTKVVSTYKRKQEQSSGHLWAIWHHGAQEGPKSRSEAHMLISCCISPQL